MLVSTLDYSSYPAQIGGIVERRDEHLERPVGVGLRRRDRVQNGLEQRVEIGPRGLEVERGSPRAARRITEGPVELLRRSLRVREQPQDVVVPPRRRSSGCESITRSFTCWLTRNTPAWRSIWSTSVVFPWSTWAMMAMLRICKGLGPDDAYVRAQSVRGAV